MFEGELMNFANVDRRHLGAYLCIAKNEVPPAVSKRVFLNVNCKTSNMKISYSHVLKINHFLPFSFFIGSCTKCHNHE